MRTVVLLGLILLLVIAAVESEYEFGDMISFTRTRTKKSFKHFAVYVGPKAHEFGQGPDMDIFHRIRYAAADGKYCVFGSLKDEPEHQKENYMDKWWTKSSDADIIKHIKAMMKDCGIYNLRTNNCEHLATYVRYGKANLKQPGTKMRFICMLFGGERACPEADEAVKKMSNEEVKILEKHYENSEIEDQDQGAQAG